MNIKSLIASIALTTTIYGAQTVKLAGDMNYPPYSFIENGVAKGVYVDIINKAFDKLPNYDVKFNMMAYKRAIAMTKQGKIVGFFPPYYGIDRTSWTKFSEPILAETTIIFAKEDTLKNKVKYPEDFYGTTACLNRGFNKSLLGGDKFSKAIKDKKINLIEANDNKACLNRVKRGIADFYINDQLIDISMFPSIKRGMKVKENFGHVGFTLKDSKYKYMKDLQTQFNKRIKQMKQNGEIQKILNSYKQ